MVLHSWFDTVAVQSANWLCQKSVETIETVETATAEVFSALGKHCLPPLFQCQQLLWGVRLEGLSTPRYPEHATRKGVRNPTLWISDVALR